MKQSVVEDRSLYDQKALFGRVSRGEIEAFRELFDTYRTRLYAAALKITKSEYAAEEIVQEIFASLWESRANLAQVDNPPAYIFTIAYNKSFRYLKKVASDLQLLQSLRERMEPAHNETEQWLEVKETREFIDHVVKELPPQRQLIYKLSRDSGLTHQQIADQLQISPLTVKKQIVLALRNIRSGLAKIAPLLAFLFLHTRL